MGENGSHLNTIEVSDATWDGKRVFFLSEEGNLLLSTDLNCNSIKILAQVPCVQPNIRSTDSIIYKNGKLYLAPFDSEFILVYDIENNAWTKLDSGIKGRYFVSLDSVFDNRIFFIGITVPHICCLDEKSGIIIHIDEPYKELIGLHKGERYLNRSCVRRENKMILLSAVDNSVLSVDTDTFMTKRMKTGKGENIFNGLDYRGDELWLLCRDRSVLLCVDENGINREVALPKTDERGISRGPFVIYDRVYVSFSTCSNVCYVDNRYKVVSSNEKWSNLFKLDYQHFVIYKSKGEIEIHCGEKKEMGTLSVAAKQINEISRSYDYTIEGMVNESFYFDLKEFLIGLSMQR